MRSILYLLILPFALATTPTTTSPPYAGCTPGSKVATYDDLPSIPITDGISGLSGSFNPYLDLNYTRFQVSPQGWILYNLSQLSAGPLAILLAKLALLLGPLGSLPVPLPLQQPAIIGATAKTTFRLEKFNFTCTIRSGGVPNLLPAANGTTPPGVIPFPCYIVIRPVEPERAGQKAVCSFSGGDGFETCDISLPAGKGFRFLTYGNVTSFAGLWQLQSKFAALYANILNPLVEYGLVSFFDNVTYTQNCTG